MYTVILLWHVSGCVPLSLNEINKINKMLKTCSCLQENYNFLFFSTFSTYDAAELIMDNFVKNAPLKILIFFAVSTTSINYLR